MRQGSLAIFGAAVAVAAFQAAMAHTVVAIDFDSTPDAWGCCQAQNLTVNGFRISPVHHVDIFDYGAPDGWDFPAADVAMGWDSAGPFNPDYVGPPCDVQYGTCVFIDLFGQSFSLLSFSRGLSPITVESSKGGILELNDPAYAIETLSLQGPKWRDIQWIMFSGDDPGAPNHFVDDLTFSTVAAPAVGWLLAPAFGLVGWFRRRPRMSFRVELGAGSL